MVREGRGGAIEAADGESPGGIDAPCLPETENDRMKRGRVRPKIGPSAVDGRGGIGPAGFSRGYQVHDAPASPSQA